MEYILQWLIILTHVEALRRCHRATHEYMICVSKRLLMAYSGRLRQRSNFGSYVVPA